MIAPVYPIDVPMKLDKDGVMRVGNTRVTLQTLIAAYHRGDTPEQLVDSFDVLNLADVYAIISYYLSHTDEIDQYIHQQKEESQRLRHELETNHPEMFTMQAKMRALFAQKRQEDND